MNVRPEKQEALLKKMKEYGIEEKDFVEKFIRGSGKGGQKKNKTSSAVYLKHLPTGLEVKVEREREQSINRFLARREIVELYERHVLKIQTVTHLEQAKIKKQKSTRKRRAIRKASE